MTRQRGFGRPDQLSTLKMLKLAGLNCWLCLSGILYPV